LSTSRVAQDDDFTITGTAKGTKNVDILIVSPKGAGGTTIDGADKNIYKASASVSETDYSFRKKIGVGGDVDTGSYVIGVLSPGPDGEYGKTGWSSIDEALDDYTTTGRTQAEILEIIDDITYLSDDLLWVGAIKVEAPFVSLNPIASVGVGEPLVVTGTTNREEGFTIVVTCKGPVELTPITTTVENGTFSATFDTAGATVGPYTVKADDGDGHTDEATVNIGPEAPPTPTPTATEPTATPTLTATVPPPTPTPTATEPTATPTEPTPGFEAIFAIAGLLAVAYLVLRIKK
jgi:PGF-CTERM protein